MRMRRSTVARVGQALGLALWLAALPVRSPAATPDDAEWRGTAEQKIWGLMQVWGTVKYNFAFFARLPDLDWDAEVRAAIPRVLGASDQEDYYRRLNELTALLRDGHTLVVSPSLREDAYANPPLEFQVVEGRIVLARAGDTEEIRAQGIRPGMELLAVGDGVPARQWLEENALRYYPGSTRQNGEAFGMFLFLRGPKNTTVKLTLRDASGATTTITVTRNSRNRDGTVFQPRIRDFSRLVEARTLGRGIAYLRVATFDDEKVVEEVNAELDRLPLDRLRGMILDLRYNMGGDDRFAYPIVSRFVDRPVLGARWRTPEYHPAYASWGEAEKPLEGEPVRIEPAAGRRYMGPLVILTGPNTMSTSEDFLVPLDYSGRALIVGEPTAGTTGNPVNVRLPGGAILRVCSLWSTYPDGREFVGRGIEPGVVVHPTLAGIRAGRDEVLERAVEVLGNWSAYRTRGGSRQRR
jgi:carboxyl-terminal processing protease